MNKFISVRQDKMLDSFPGNQNYCTGKISKFQYLAYFDTDLTECIHDGRREIHKIPILKSSFCFSLSYEYQ